MRFAHQAEEYRRHKYDRARALLWQMRTGKTRMAVESAVALYEALEIRGVLVVAPNGVHTQWANEQIERWGGGKYSYAWRFTDRHNLQNFGEFMAACHAVEGLHWLCVNMEVVIRDDVRKIIAKFKKAVGPAMLVVDESHHFARAGSKRTGVARGLGRQFEYKRILTGTVSENSWRQVFSQFEILKKGALGHTTMKDFDEEFTHFKTIKAHDKFLTVPDKCSNPAKLKRLMSRHASVVLRSDCEDLPPIQRDHRIAEMTTKQQRFWEMIKEKELEASEAEGVNKVFHGGAALVKLQQVEGGFYLDHDSESGRSRVVRDLCGKDNPKMLILLDEIMQYDGQSIVWFEYVHELEAAMGVLGTMKIPAVRFHGRVNETERQRSLSQFREGKSKVLLAQPRAGGEGRDMSAAGKIIWYSHTNDAIVRSQADERATAMGGKSVQVVDIMTPVGGYFRRLTENKMVLAGELAREGLRKVIQQLGRR